jgi:hypothetical protein
MDTRDLHKLFRLDPPINVTAGGDDFMDQPVNAPAHLRDGLDPDRSYSLYAVAIRHASKLVRTFDAENYAILLLWPRGGEVPMEQQDYHIDLLRGEQLSIKHEAAIGHALAAGKSVALYCYDFTYKGQRTYGDASAMSLFMNMHERLRLEGLVMDAGAPT